MIINSRSSNFQLIFPKGFFSKSILERWEPFVKRLPLPYDNLHDYMTSTVQSINFPSLTMDPVSQVRTLGKQQEYKNARPIADLFTREITIDFKTHDGYVNYWMFLENILEDHLNFTQKEQYMKDPLMLRFLNQEGYVLFTALFKGIYFRSLSELQFSYADVQPEFRTFSATFGFFSHDFIISND